MKTKLKFLLREDKYIDNTIAVKYVCVIDKSVFSNIPVNLKYKILEKYHLLRDKQIKFTVIGRATCCKTDTFDKVRGFRIAESRAKAKAYSKMYRICKEIDKYFYGILADNCSAKDKNIMCFIKELNHIRHLTNGQ